jgi:N-acetylmuramoyl-L-alanine amidase
MNRIVDLRPHLAKQAVSVIAGIALFVLTCAVPSLAAPDAKSDARDQFATAVRMRTMLEGYLEKDRAASDYKQTIAAYQKVFDISTEAEDAPAALMAEAELYEEMGHLYDQKYYDTSIKTYLFLLNEYPSTQYRSAALFAIGQIQQSDQNKLVDAQATFRDFLKKYSRSDKAADARNALKQIAANLSPTSAPAQGTQGQAAPPQSATVQTPMSAAPAQSVAVADDPAVAGTVITPREADGRLSSVKDVQTTNGRDTARVIIALDDTVDFQSARIASPDRIYFNLSRATLGPKVGAKQFDSAEGLLRSLRVAQNRPDVVRVVLDAPSAKDYSAYLLSKPYRLVIEMSSQTGGVTARQPEVAVSPAIGKPASNNSSAVADAAPSQPPAPAPVQAKETPVSLERKPDVPSSSIRPPPAPKPTSDGDTSLTRALGLKIHRIVIDPGHGGHDTGTIGPHGLLEKDLCLDVALRLGREIEQKLPGAEVVYTRQDDTFIPLEQRTQIANDAKADLFISIHANSSHDDTARGVETYYLNFSTSDESMEVAARENAASEESLHDLQDIIKKIARNDKIEESKEFAGDVQESLAHKLETTSPAVRDRGVKQAPFVVLIGADMPSILAEISFVSNPTDEKLLKATTQRQRIADGLFHGITSYLDSLNSLNDNKQKSASTDSPATPSAPDNHLVARNTSTTQPSAK